MLKPVRKIAGIKLERKIWGMVLQGLKKMAHVLEGSEVENGEGASSQ